MEYRIPYRFTLSRRSQIRSSLLNTVENYTGPPCVTNSLPGRVSLGCKGVVPSARICYNILRSKARLTF